MTTLPQQSEVATGDCAAQSPKTPPQWLRLGAHWLIIMGMALGVALLWMVIDLHAPANHLAQLALWLGISGTGSLAIGAVAFGLVDVAHIGSARLKFAIPSVLAAFVVGLNTLVAARMMFISVADAQMLIAFLIFGVCVALVMSSSVVATLAQALRHVTQGAQRLAEGEYSVRLDETGGSIAECDQLAQSFNHMATNVQLAFAQRDAAEANRRQVIAAISHDVRTPLTVMRAMLEAIDDGVVTEPEIIHRYHRAIRGEIQHLNLLVDDLFEVSRIEAGAVQLHRDPLNIADLVSDLLAASHEQAERHQIALSGYVAPDVPVVWADARQMYRVLTNLVQNSLRHTAAGGQIVLSVTCTAQQVIMRVVDTGEGISATDLPSIFEPAYRGEASRKRERDDAVLTPGGTGLGLAIARGLVEAHGGAIQAISPLPDDLRPLPDMTSPGTAVCLTLPLEPSAKTALSAPRHMQNAHEQGAVWGQKQL
jgi:signal transduction histidine kinase